MAISALTPANSDRAFPNRTHCFRVRPIKFLQNCRLSCGRLCLRKGSRSEGCPSMSSLRARRGS
jgi:hypothetical protein